ncbi:acyl carrier protein [Plantactinospora sp. B6F1]|uniref:phosphopantetheine-binding protein n=1 Tax=Plantactinospora sp. B6F1 TaxID=3158971 RepID=UPI00102C6F94
MNTSERTQEDLLPEVRRAWAEVLGSTSAESVPLDVNFLEAGGNSLLLVMLWEELQTLVSRPLKLSELFQHATVRAQAALLVGTPDAAKPAEPAVPEQRSLLASRRAAAAPVGGGAAV